MNKRVQRRRTRGWRMPPNTLYVGRPTRWGNPFHVISGIGRFRVAFELAMGGFAARNKQEAVDRYREWLDHPDQQELRDAVKLELRGKDLACWCGASPCHADVLLEVAREPDAGHASIKKGTHASTDH